MNKKTQLYLDPPRHQYLKDRAEREKKSLAQIIREMVDRERNVVVDHTKDPIWSIVGMVKTGPRSNVAENKHTYLYGTEEQIAELEKAELVRDRPRRRRSGRPLR